MGWKIEFAATARKELKRLDRTEAKRILGFLHDRVILHGNPRLFGKPLKGQDGEIWRYRVGNYRIICELQEATMVVLVARVGHRKAVYR